MKTNFELARKRKKKKEKET